MTSRFAWSSAWSESRRQPLRDAVRSLLLAANGYPISTHSAGDCRWAAKKKIKNPVRLQRRDRRTAVTVGRRDIESVVERPRGSEKNLESLLGEAAHSEQAHCVADVCHIEQPMHAMYVHKTLGNMLRPDDCLVFDGGDFCHFGRAYLPSRQPRRWWYVPTLGMLGSALPTAIAAKLAYPDSRVVMLTGDGAFGFNAMEFDTAVRHNLPVVGILGNDSAWLDLSRSTRLYLRPVWDHRPTEPYEKVSQAWSVG